MTDFARTKRVLLLHASSIAHKAFSHIGIISSSMDYPLELVINSYQDNYMSRKVQFYSIIPILLLYPRPIIFLP